MSKPRLSVPQGFSVLLGLLAAATLAAQVLTATTKTTPLETALFGVLQFVFSLAFAWLLTRIAAKQEFIESQRSFAIAAFRRINEIDEGVERLIARIAVEKKTAAPESRADLETLGAMAVGVRATIKSSIADWGDIIGDEIATINHIERIRDQQTQTESASEESTASSPSDTAELREQLQQSSVQIAQLMKSLPPSLRVLADEGRRKSDPAVEHQNRLEQERKRTGAIALEGFWDPTMERDIRELSVGDRLKLVVGDVVGDRILVVAVRDMDDRVVGIIQNRGAQHYYVFTEALSRCIHGTRCDVIITQVAQESKAERWYFSVTLPPNAFAARDRLVHELDGSVAKPRRLTNR